MSSERMHLQKNMLTVCRSEQSKGEEEEEPIEGEGGPLKRRHLRTVAACIRICRFRWHPGPPLLRAAPCFTHPIAAMWIDCDHQSNSKIPLDQQDGHSRASRSDMITRRLRERSV